VDERIEIELIKLMLKQVQITKIKMGDELI
jgi:hypothetical protein